MSKDMNKPTENVSPTLMSSIHYLRWDLIPRKFLFYFLFYYFRNIRDAFILKKRNLKRPLPEGNPFPDPSVQHQEQALHEHHYVQAGLQHGVIAEVSISNELDARTVL
jgi:hypothetical protein